MQNFYSLLKQCPLFHEINEQELSVLLDCLSASVHTYSKNQVIFHTDDPVTSVGIVLSGGVKVVKEDILGNSSILAKIPKGGLFGESFACAQIKKLPVSVFADTDSTILMINLKRIHTPCNSVCSFHSKLIQNMLGILANKTILLNQKLEHLSKRTTRDKLISYLSAQSRASGSKQFTIPFNRQELADYLCVDRSAMSNELSKLRKMGCIRFQKNIFEIIQQ